MGKVSELHKELLLHQGEMTDAEFAGLWPRMSRSYWQALRAKTLPLSAQVCAQAREVWPELWRLSIDAESELALTPTR